MPPLLAPKPQPQSQSRWSQRDSLTSAAVGEGQASCQALPPACSNPWQEGPSTWPGPGHLTPPGGEIGVWGRLGRARPDRSCLAPELSQVSSLVCRLYQSRPGGHSPQCPRACLAAAGARGHVAGIGGVSRRQLPHRALLSAQPGAGLGVKASELQQSLLAAAPAGGLWGCDGAQGGWTLSGLHGVGSRAVPAPTHQGLRSEGSVRRSWFAPALLDR